MLATRAAAALPEDDRAQVADSLVADALRPLGADDADIEERVKEPLD